VALENGFLPFLAAAGRRLHNGQLNHYIPYIFVAPIILLALSDLL